MTSPNAALPCFSILDHAQKLCLDELSIEIGYGIFKRIFVALLALALVAAGFESTSQNWNTLKVRTLVDLEIQEKITAEIRLVGYYIN